MLFFYTFLAFNFKSYKTQKANKAKSLSQVKGAHRSRTRDASDVKIETKIIMINMLKSLVETSDRWRILTKRWNI